MRRLVNIHNLPLETGVAGKSERVRPGETGDFNDSNRSVASWIQLRWLVPEGEVLASRAAALTDAPSAAEMFTMRQQLAEKEIVIKDLRERDKARDEEAKRVEVKFGELAAKQAEGETALAAAKARITELEGQIETLTAPTPPPAADPSTGTGEPAAPAASGRSRRTG